jgi:hypothetical protein
METGCNRVYRYKGLHVMPLRFQGAIGVHVVKNSKIQSVLIIVLIREQVICNFCR